MDSSSTRSSRSYRSSSSRRTTSTFDFTQTLYRYLMLVRGCAAVDAEKLVKPPYGRVYTAAAKPGGGCSSFGRAAYGSRRRSSAVEEEDAEDEDFFVVEGNSSESRGSAFLFGPTGLHSVFMPLVHMADDTTRHLLLLREGHLQLILLLHEHSGFPIHDPAFLQHLRNFALEAGLRDLEKVLAQEFHRVVHQEDIFRFIYFNTVNQAVRVSNRSPPRSSSSPAQFPGCCFTCVEVFRLAQLHRRLACGAAAATSRSSTNMFSSPGSCCYTSCPSSCGSCCCCAAASGGTTEKQQRTVPRSSSSDTTETAAAAAAGRGSEQQQQQQALLLGDIIVHRSDTACCRSNGEIRERESETEAAAAAAPGETTRGELLRAVAQAGGDVFTSTGTERDTSIMQNERRAAGIDAGNTASGTSGSSSNTSSNNKARRSCERDARRCGICSCCHLRRKNSEKGTAVQFLAVKDADSGWLLGKVSLQREYFLALDNVKATLSDALEEVERFNSMHLASIFM